MKIITIQGVWDDVLAPSAPSVEESAFEDAAKSGAPIPIRFDIGDGMAYDAMVTVSRTSDGEFTCAPVTPLKRKLLRPARGGAERLPA